MYKGEIPREQYDSAPGERWSRIKNMRKSPLHYKHAADKGERSTDVFRLGGAVHCAVLEPEHFESRYVVYSESKTSGEGCRGRWADFQSAHSHLTILAPDEMLAVNGMAAAVRAHPQASKLLAQGRAEVPLTWIDKRTGIACKSRLDWVTRQHMMIEFKSAASIDQRTFANQAWKYGYFHQVWQYACGLAAQLDRDPDKIETAVIAVESSEPHDVAVYLPCSDSLYAAREEVEQILDTLAECRRTGIYPGRYTEQTILTAPRYVLDSEDEDWQVSVKE